MTTSSASKPELTRVRITTEPLQKDPEAQADVHQRSGLVPGFDHKALSDAYVLLVGGGGLGGQISRTLVRKGIGELDIVDPDFVEITNCNRQPFGKDDLFEPKAHRLAMVAAREATDRTVVTGIHKSFQELVAGAPGLSPDIVIIGVDNDETRLDASAFCHQRKIPGVFLGVSVDAGFGYVCVQSGKATDPCWLCHFPEAATKKGRMPCDAGSTIDILLAIGGIATYAVDSLLMRRPRAWTYREICLSGEVPELIKAVKKRPDCAICGSGSNSVRVPEAL